MLRHCRSIGTATLHRSLRSAIVGWQAPGTSTAKRTVPALVAAITTSTIGQQNMVAASTQSAIEGLEPASLWKFFEQLSNIPRPSKHEQKVLSWLKDFANTRGLETEQDDVGNLVIRRPGTGGGEQAPAVVIQGHIDMVCEKNNDTQHDFFTDPIRLQRKGDWLTATGTTLGADNGIGVCAALALLDMPTTAKLPPLECLFTVDEETGLTGAFGISSSLLKGRTMLNLDTEDWGELFIGCAGGGDSQLSLPLHLEPAPEGMLSLDLKVGGLLGGHSGLNIAEGRGNALQILVRAVNALEKQIPGVRVAAVNGGDKRNAIPREASAVLLVDPASKESAQVVIEACNQEVKCEYGRLETGLSIKLASSGSQHNTVITKDSLARLLQLLSVLPHGPLKFSHDVPGLVETSSNLASVKMQQQADQPGTATAVIMTSTRSSLGPALEAVRDQIQAAAALSGASLERKHAYPGWQPNLNSGVLQLTRDCYKELTGQDAKVSAIHAGLECGILGERFLGMDTVSFGPTIKGAHSPDERVQISTVLPFWQLTLKVLERLAERRL